MRPARDHSAYDLGYSRDGGSDKSKSSGGLIRVSTCNVERKAVIISFLFPFPRRNVKESSFFCRNLRNAEETFGRMRFTTMLRVGSVLRRENHKK